MPSFISEYHKNLGQGYDLRICVPLPWVLSDNPDDGCQTRNPPLTNRLGSHSQIAQVSIDHMHFFGDFAIRHASLANACLGICKSSTNVAALLCSHERDRHNVFYPASSTSHFQFHRLPASLDPKSSLLHLLCHTAASPVCHQALKPR